MAEDQDRPRKGSVLKAPSWKIFTAFKVALDPKKLLLAGMGILVTAVAWWLWSWIFYNLTSMPVAENYLKEGTTEENERAFRRLKVDRERWNFLHQVAGPRSHVLPDLVDVAKDLQEYEVAKPYTDAHGQLKTRVEILEKKDHLIVGDNRDNPIKLVELDLKNPVLEKVRGPNKFVLRDLVLDPTRKTVIIANKYELRVEEDARFAELKKIRDNARELAQIQADIDEKVAPGQTPSAARVYQLVSDVGRMQSNINSKPSGEFRTFPWSEYRGPNPYLTVARIVEQAGSRTCSSRL